MKVRFLDCDCDLVCPGVYGNHRPCLRLQYEGQPMATATVNIPEEDLGEDEVFIKDYNENAGMYNALVTAGVITPTDRWVNAGHEEALVGKLTPAAKKLL